MIESIIRGFISGMSSQIAIQPQPTENKAAQVVAKSMYRPNNSFSGGLWPPDMVPHFPPHMPSNPVAKDNIS
jgi:hypothetical protein